MYDFPRASRRRYAAVRLTNSVELAAARIRTMAGIEYGGGDYVSPTAGASLTFGRRYGARFILHVGDESGGTVRFQMGGYVSF